MSIPCARTPCPHLATEVVLGPGDRPIACCRYHTHAAADFPRAAELPHCPTPALYRAWAAAERKLQAKLKQVIQVSEQRLAASAARERIALDGASGQQVLEVGL